LAALLPPVKSGRRVGKHHVHAYLAFYKGSEANPELLMMCGMSKSSSTFSWHWKTMKENHPSSVSGVII